MILLEWGEKIFVLALLTKPEYKKIKVLNSTAVCVIIERKWVNIYNITREED